MADSESLELDEVLEQITFYCLDQMQARIEAGVECTPFTVVVEGDQMFEESFPGDDVVTCRNAAQANVKSASTFATHYAFCYDGFLMTDNGELDAIIVECATRDQEQAYVIGQLYEFKGEKYEFEPTPAYLDDAESFFDRAAVNAAKAREAVEASDPEMIEAQELLRRNLAGDE